MREIVFDTETTGLRAENGDRVLDGNDLLHVADP